MTLFLEFLGWIGTFLLVYAFYKNSVKKSKISRKNYLILNSLGSVLLCFDLANKGSYPGLVLNLVWLAISLKSLLGK
jgi:hypothetical protein